MERIESTQNPRVKAARALHTVKGRDRSGLFLCEGEHMVREALHAARLESPLYTPFVLGSAFAVDTLFIAEEQAERYADLVSDAQAAHVVLVPAHVMEAISTVKTPQGVAAVVRLQSPRVTQGFTGAGVTPAAFGISGNLDALEAEEPADAALESAADSAVSPSILGEKLVLLEAVQDPGNVGTILRTMDAAGFHGAILAPGCADPFSPKALRATMGSIFRVPTLQADSAAQAAAALRDEGYAVVAAELAGSDFFMRGRLPGRLCLIIGNEGAGVTPETLAIATHRYRLPMKGGAESLNAAVAAAIMIYDIAYRP